MFPELSMKNILTAAMLLLASAPLSAHALSSPSYTITLNTVANGGGSVGSAGYKLSSLIGQPLVVGPVSSVGYTVQGGFYYLHRLEELLAKRNTSLVFDSAALYAGFDGSGIWKSTDNGATWNAAATQPANQRIRGLVIHPTNRSVLFAATYGGGMFKSTTSGDVWTACANTGLGSLNATTLAMDPTGNLYAGTEGGIFASSDCSSWSAVNGGLTVDAAKPVVAIAIDPATPANLFAGLDGGGIFKSLNSGATWASTTGLPVNARVKALAMKDSSNLFAAVYGGGIYKSTTGGDSWAACATQPANLNLLSLLIDVSGKLYAGSEAGAFVSTDGCGSWTGMNAGLP